MHVWTRHLWGAAAHSAMERGDERWKMRELSMVMVKLDHIFTRVAAKIQLASYQGRPSLTFWPNQICIVIPIMINARANNIYSTGLQWLPLKSLVRMSMSGTVFTMRHAPAACSPESCRPNYQAGHWAASLHRSTAAALAGGGFTVWRQRISCFKSEYSLQL